MMMMSGGPGSLMTASSGNISQMDPAQIAENVKIRRREMLKLNGLDYEPEEQPLYRFEVREMQRVKDIGQLYLSTYKLFFMPNYLREPA
jgi:hypothetical protein